MIKKILTNKSSSTVEEKNMKDRDVDRDEGNGKKDIGLDNGEDDDMENINKDEEEE